MGEWISFVAGTSLLILGAMVILAYWPHKYDKSTGSGTLGFAIFLSFAAAVANTPYWQVIGTNIDIVPWITRDNFRDVGLYLDGFFKGAAAWAAYLHLTAIWKNLPPAERSAWCWYQMPWYPKRRACLELLANLAIWKRNQK